jgi:hypothetical protein
VIDFEHLDYAATRKLVALYCVLYLLDLEVPEMNTVDIIDGNPLVYKRQVVDLFLVVVHCQ